MKATAIILVLVCLAAFVGLGYLYMASSVVIEDVDLTICEADTQAALFDELSTQVASGCAAATVFSAEIPKTPDHCIFLQYSVKLRNSTFMTAEQIEVRISPTTGDYVQVGETLPTDIPSGSSGNVKAVLLSDREAKMVREITVSYYLWGIPFFVRTTYAK